MNTPEFISLAMVTENVPDSLGVNHQGVLAFLDVAVKAGDLLDNFKKIAIYGKPVATLALVEHIQLLEKATARLKSMVVGEELKLPNHTELAPPSIRVAHAAIGFFTESGEMLEAIVAEMLTGKLDTVNFCEEIGDTEWYKAIALDALQADEGAIRTKVINKLKARYGEKFSAHAALNRNLSAERAVLEA
jgi:hypothetical protein